MPISDGVDCFISSRMQTSAIFLHFASNSSLHARSVPCLIRFISAPNRMNGNETIKSRKRDGGRERKNNKQFLHLPDDFSCRTAQYGLLLIHFPYKFEFGLPYGVLRNCYKFAFFYLFASFVHYSPCWHGVWFGQRSHFDVTVSSL